MHLYFAYADCWFSGVADQINIRKTCPCNVYSLEPQFYIAKLGYAGVYLFFSSPEPLGSQGELIGWP